MKKSILILTLALPLLGASCFNLKENLTNAVTEKATETVLEGITGSKDVQLNGNQVSVTGTNGEKIEIGTDTLPADFPSEVPVYQNSDVLSSFSNGKTDDQGVWTVTFTSSDPLATVNSFFEQALKINGWTTTYAYSLDQSYGYTAKNGTLSATVTISTGDDGKSDIFMSISRETEENTNSNE